MSYQIGICEDEKIFQDSLAELIKIISREQKIPVKVHTFSNLNRMRSFMEDPLEEPLDLILLDIYLEEEKTGMDFAKELRSKGDNTNIIFITNSDDFVLDGYTIDSKAYVLKPVKKEILEEALLRTLKTKDKDRIILKTPSKTLTLDLNTIGYIEIINKELIIHYLDSTTDSLRMTLKDIKDFLPQDQFIQSHRSYIVSLPAIKSIENRDILLTNGEEVPVSRKFTKHIHEKLMDWYLKE